MTTIHKYQKPLALASLALCAIWPFGHLFTSVPAIYEHFWPISTNIYWGNRLLASLVLGSMGMFLGSVLYCLALYLRFMRKEQVASHLLFMISGVFQFLLAADVLFLTPSDWPHTIPHFILLATSLYFWLTSNKI